MIIVAHSYPFVIGVDTHADPRRRRSSPPAVKNSPASSSHPPLPASAARSREVGRRAGGDLAALWVIEGIGSYVAQLAHELADAGYGVVEVEAPRINARARRGTGKPDPLDAKAIAAAALLPDVAQSRRPRRDDGTRATSCVLVTSAGADDDRSEISRERAHRAAAHERILTMPASG